MPQCRQNFDRGLRPRLARLGLGLPFRLGGVNVNATSDQLGFACALSIRKLVIAGIRRVRREYGPDAAIGLVPASGATKAAVSSICPMPLLPNIA